MAQETNYNQSKLDPYGFAIRKIMYGLNVGLKRLDQMNDYEADTLQRIYVILEERDPAALTSIREDRK